MRGSPYSPGFVPVRCLPAQESLGSDEPPYAPGPCSWFLFLLEAASSFVDLSLPLQDVLFCVSVHPVTLSQPLSVSGTNRFALQVGDASIENRFRW